MLSYLGKTIIPFKYDFISTSMPDEKGPGFLVIVQLKTKMGVINQNNEFVVPLTAFGLNDLHKTCIVATDGKKTGLLNYKLKAILPFEFETIVVDKQKIIAAKEGYQYYFSITGKLLKKVAIAAEGVKNN